MAPEGSLPLLSNSAIWHDAEPVQFSSCPYNLLL